VTSSIGRRSFLKIVGAGAGAAGAATLLGSHPVLAQEHEMTPEAQMGGDAAEMDAHHGAGVQTFLDRIGQDEAFWGTKLAPEMDGDVKVFNITCEEVEWLTTPDTAVPALAYNGIVPGPEIRVTEGDQIRVNVTNNIPSQSTAVHFHGLRVPNNMDGVPFITQEPIRPGETFTYEFTVRNSGTHIYHSHHNATEQVTRGLFGAFIVEPRDASREPEVSADYVMVLNDSSIGFTINGRGFPYTQPIVAKLGDRIRIRYLNEGLMIHPMHLHGMPQLVFAKDGYYLPAPYLCDTLNIAPGERYDVIVDCDELGAWAFHCHILSHAEARTGMFGMVTALVVQE
jgi:FtsP/CotA-like multicopper oxidase with cupredoxin domain